MDQLMGWGMLMLLWLGAWAACLGTFVLVLWILDKAIEQAWLALKRRKMLRRR